MTLKRFVKKHLRFLIMLRNFFDYININYLQVNNPSRYGYLDNHTTLQVPLFCANPKLVYFESCRIRYNLKVINSTGKFIVKKYSAIAPNCTVVTGNHRPIVGIPQLYLNACHIKDKETDIIVEESVWIGVNSTLLAGAHIGRGAIIGACSMVNRDIPPYAVAVGSPAKVIASVFTIEQIIEHEKQVYPEDERLSRQYLEELFTQHYEGKKSIGLDVPLTQDEIKKINKFKTIIGFGI